MKETEFLDWLVNGDADKAEIIKLEIASKIDSELSRSGMTRSSLAKKIGTSPAWITKILRGDVNLTIETIVKLSEALDLDLNLSFSKRVKTSHSADIFQFPVVEKKFFGGKEFRFKSDLVFSELNDCEFENAA